MIFKPICTVFCEYKHVNSLKKEINWDFSVDSVYYYKLNIKENERHIYLTIFGERLMRVDYKKYLPDDNKYPDIIYTPRKEKLKRILGI